MTRLHLLLAAACVALSAACVALSASAAPAADVADLFPPGTLAYAELHNPAELGPQFAAAVGGTALEKGLPFLRARKDGGGPSGPPAPLDLARLVPLLAPEVTGEFGKLGGVAVGLAGFTPRGAPEAVFVLLTGDSPAAEKAARAIAAGPGLKRVGEVAGVPVLQYRPAEEVAEEGDEPKPKDGKKDEKPKEGEYEPTLAHAPGLLVVGTSKAALAPVVKRFRGEEKGGLGGAAGFKAAAAEYRKPGLFFYADAPSLFAGFDAAGRARGGDGGPDALAWLRLLAGPKALTAVAGSVQFRDGGLSLAAGLWFDPAAPSALRDVFAGPPVATAPRDIPRPAFAATVALPDKDRGAAVLNLFDAVAKARGELGPLPGDVAKELARRYGVAPADLLAKVRAVTVIVPAQQELPKGATPVPLFVLHSEDAATAAALEAFAPKLVAEMAGEKEPPQPASETVGGVKVLSLAGTGLPWKGAVHYARRGAVLAWGLDRKLVAAAVSTDLGDKAPTPPAGAALAGALDAAALLGALGAEPTAGGLVRPAAPLSGVRGGEMVPSEALRKEADKARAAFLAAAGALPLAEVSVRRDGGRLRVEVFQPKATGAGLKPVAAAGLAWAEKWWRLGNPGRGDSAPDDEPRPLPPTVIDR